MIFTHGRSHQRQRGLPRFENMQPERLEISEYSPTSRFRSPFCGTVSFKGSLHPPTIRREIEAPNLGYGISIPENASFDSSLFFFSRKEGGGVCAVGACLSSRLRCAKRIRPCLHCVCVSEAGNFLLNVQTMG